MRALLLLAAGLLLPLAAHAHSQLGSPTAGADCTNQAGIGTVAWGTPGNAISSDNGYASAAVDGTTTNYLRCLNYGFTIPAGATVLGIQVRVERKSNSTANGGSNDAAMRLVKGGVIEATDRSTATIYTTADVVELHGSATDLWGTTWTPAQINATDFGAAFAATKPNAAGAAHTITVDHVQIEVFYSEAPAAPTLVSPADGATVTTPTPTFSWNAAADPDGDTLTYDIQADDSGCGFGSPELDQSGIAGTSFTPGASLPNATYCWRVRAVDEHGVAGSWSATRDVTVSGPLSQTRSPSAAGDCTNQAGIGTVAWGSTGNAISSDNSYASAAVDGSTTNYLSCLNYAFSIPAGATILGIEVGVERKSNSTANGGSSDAAMRLVKAGTIQATDGSTATIYTTADVVELHGSATDLWGTTWTPAEINAADFGAAFAATKPSAAGAAHTITVDHVAITVHYTIPVVATPGSFNAFDTGTAAGAITGVIQTKVAGAAFSLDVVAILSGAQLSTFSNQVSVELLGNTALGIALDAQNCPTSFTLVQTVSPASITSGRSTVAFAAVANAWRDVRVRVRYPTGAPTVTSCSTDNFAIRPASFTLAASDNDWQTAGTNRALTNTGATNGVVHKAGRNFTLTVTPSPGTATNYAGDPTVSALTCTLPAICANGTLTPGTFAGAGTRTSNTATYSEAGAFNLTLVDQTFAQVDAGDGTPADCTAAGRYVCDASAPLAVGRFVPDHFAIVAGTAPQFRTFDVLDAACSGARSFTYVGQQFGYATAPTATVEARNAGGGVTSNYRGTLWKLTATGVTQTFSHTGKTIDAALGAPGLSEIANSGTGTLSAAAGDKISFARTTAEAPFTANISLNLSVSDASEIVDAVQGPFHGTITTTTPLVYNGAGSGIAFDAGAEIRFGRLRLPNAHGSQLTPLPLLMEAHYWASAALGFVTNVDDHCTAIANGDVAMTFTGNVSPAPTCKTALSGGGTLSSGRRTLMLSAPGSANDGAAQLTVNLNTASGTTCAAVGVNPVAATGAARSYLRGNWTGAAFTDDPTARATFGAFRGAGEVIFIRENF